MDNLRKSNIELLRIAAMVLVMIVHADFKAIGVPSSEEIIVNFGGSFCRFFVESLSVVCVNVFVLISGWFGIKIRIKRFVEFLFQILFICFVVVLLYSSLIGNYNLDSFKWIITLGDDYWFIFSYTILYVFSPILNSFVDNVNKRQIEMFLISFYSLQTIFSFFLNVCWINDGYSPLSFFGLYLLARYMRLHYDVCHNNKKNVGLLVFFILAFVNTLVGMIIVLSGKWSIWLLYSYSSPIIIGQSLCLLMYFSNLRFINGVVNWIAVSCFSVYLVHCCTPFFHGTYLPLIKKWYQEESQCFFLVYTTIWIIFVFVFSILLDKIRIRLWKIINNIIPILVIDIQRILH